LCCSQAQTFNAVTIIEGFNNREKIREAGISGVKIYRIELKKEKVKDSLLVEEISYESSGNPSEIKNYHERGLLNHFIYTYKNDLVTKIQETNHEFKIMSVHRQPG
jgi:hypothetical protein